MFGHRLKKRFESGRRAARLGYVLLLILSGVAAVGYYHFRDLRGRYESMRAKSTMADAEQQRCDEMEAINGRSRERVKSLGEDPLEWEADIRHNKVLVRDGETIYRLQPEEEGSAHEEPAPAEQP
ncbi:MAG TPA: hypothetical protein PLO37_02135 [Candidatus Hydrogenedentes bacterium]|nr:hypothetical protein [Candidatus Hydrogenedentota bacterium]HPG65617.1 hypothetical protein [Candidatus Hydrogenedentota bacterium]